ncbi:MAG: RcnB family protein [Rhizomicrobium sp.]
MHYGVGAYLPRVYWIDDYYVNDYADYGLDEPPPGFAWLRYGPDLVLLDQDSGEIEQVVPGAFAEVDDGGGEDDGGE